VAFELAKEISEGGKVHSHHSSIDLHWMGETAKLFGSIQCYGGQ